jgi:glycosyltransferase A (GT-A) superfamily protein (DUF2064 family)
MKITTESRENGIQWTPQDQVDDVDFADDLALLSNSCIQMQDDNDILYLYRMAQLV